MKDAVFKLFRVDLKDGTNVDVLVPFSLETIQFIEKKKTGSVLTGDFKQPRNYEFHKKFFSLLDLGYGQFNPIVKHKGITLRKNKEQFREDIIIAAGYYRSTFDLQGNLKLRAKSISFGRMTQETFEKLYSRVIDVLLENVLHNYTREEAEKAAEELIRYA